MAITRMNQHHYVFIMAGGVGSRFWPKSRNAFPKQFIDILGIGKSLLQLTYERFLKVCPPENIFVVTNSHYKSLIQEQLPAIGDSQILCEPSRNNTGPSIAYAALRLMAKDPDATMVVAPSDHFILNEDSFVRHIKKALEITTAQPLLLTLGIQPTRPDTGYGYIRFNGVAQADMYKVQQFTEKPGLDKAREFVDSGNYLWNAGIFIWHVQTIANAFRELAPEIYGLLEPGTAVFNTPDEQNFINLHYPNTPNISIDYAIMEKADNVYTIPVNFGWSDLGTWASLYDVTEKQDIHNNALSGKDFQLEDTENCIIHIGKDKLAVVRGLKDFVVVDNDDVLLIYPKPLEQEIKKVTERLKTDGKSGYL
jgi:mannose-1-phosphate guanylyltransferase